MGRLGTCKVKMSGDGSNIEKQMERNYNYKMLQFYFYFEKINCCMLDPRGIHAISSLTPIIQRQTVHEGQRAFILSSIYPQRTFGTLDDKQKC